MNPGGYGLMVVQSNDDLAAEEQRTQQEQEAQQQRVESSLAAHIRRAWEQAHQAKNAVEQRMLRNLRQRNGEYDPDKIQAIRKQGGSEIFMMLTAVKCRAAKSWVRDTLLPAGDKPWTLDPSEEPDLSPEMEQSLQRRIIHDAQQYMDATGEQVTPAMMQQVGDQARDKMRDQLRQQADETAEKMASLIEDQLTDGGWSREFDDCISDIVDQGTGIIKAPVIEKTKTLGWERGPDGVKPRPQEKIRPVPRRVDPFDFYPAAGVVDPQEGDCIERHRLYRGGLYALIGVPGYREDEIRAVLREYGEGGLTDWLNWTIDSSRDKANKQDTVNQYEDDRIDALEYWGSCQGRKLHEWGVPLEDAPDPDEEYQIHAWLIGRHVIKADLNPDPLGRKPYGKACYQTITGSFWGLGVPELIRDCQAICNAAARALVNNMGIASGPQVVVNLRSLAPGESATDVYPWRVWQVDYEKMGGNSTKMPVEFYQPNPLTNDLMKVYEQFAKEAEEQSGVPAYTYGSTDVGGAGKTASGLSMLMNAASKAIKNVVGNIDQGIIEPTVDRYYVWNMLWHDDDSVKGDLRPRARGALSLVAKEQTQMRRQEFLQATANPMDYEITGMEGRAAVLREVAKGLDMEHEDVVPDDEELRQRMQQKQLRKQQEEQAGQGAGQSRRPREANAAGDPAGVATA